MTYEVREEESLSDDLLKGVDRIARFIGESKRRAYYLCENSKIPCGKEGATWVASRSRLRAHYAQLTGGAE